MTSCADISTPTQGVYNRLYFTPLALPVKILQERLNMIKQKHILLGLLDST